MIEPQRRKRRLRHYPEVEFDLLWWLRRDGEILLEINESRQDNIDQDTHSEEESELNKEKAACSISLASGQILPGTGFQLWSPVDDDDITRGQDEIKVFYRFNIISTSLPNINLTYRDVTRWKMAWRVVREHYPSTDLVVRRPRDWPSSRSLDEFSVQFGFSAAAMIYGGLHLLAWHAHFNSATEQLLWRISAALVMGGLPVGFVRIHLVDWIYYVRDKLEDRYVLVYYISEILYYVSVVLTPILMLAYILARAYLVVECFINLSHLPAGAYDVPGWSAYFPHIS